LAANQSATLAVLPRPAALHGLRRIQLDAPRLQRLAEQAFDLAVDASKIGGGAALDRGPKVRVDPQRVCLALATASHAEPKCRACRCSPRAAYRAPRRARPSGSRPSPPAFRRRDGRRPSRTRKRAPFRPCPPRHRLGYDGPRRPPAPTGGGASRRRSRSHKQGA